MVDARGRATRLRRWRLRLVGDGNQRLNPRVRQLRLWNTDDIDDTEVRNQLSADHGWYGNEVRLEQVNRIKLWRFLTGDDKFDLGYWMGRLENQPEKLLSA